MPWYVDHDRARKIVFDFLTDSGFRMPADVYTWGVKALYLWKKKEDEYAVQFNARQTLAAKDLKGFVDWMERTGCFIELDGEDNDVLITVELPGEVVDKVRELDKESK